MIFLRGKGDYSERVQFGYMEGVGCGWGVLKLVGRGKEFCGPLSIQREFSFIQLFGLQHPSYSAVLQTPKYPPPHEGRGGHKVWENISKSSIINFIFCNIYMNVDHVELVIRARKQVFTRPLCTKE